MIQMMLLLLLVVDILHMLNGEVTDIGKCGKNKPDQSICRFTAQNDQCDKGQVYNHFQCTDGGHVVCWSECTQDVDRPVRCATIDSDTSCSLSRIHSCNQTCGLGVYTREYSCPGPVLCPYLCCCYNCPGVPGPIPQFSKCVTNTQPEACIRCPTGMLPDNRVPGSCFAYVKRKDLYSDALAYCVLNFNGSSIIEVTTTGHKAVLDGLVANGYVWLGAKRDAAGDLRWGRSNTLLNVTFSASYWAVGEPDGDGDCVDMCYDCHPPESSDFSCNAQNNYVCEYTV